MDADKNLAKNLEEKSRLEIENAHKREEVLNISDFFKHFLSYIFILLKLI